jgi:hypothetical protein
MALYRFSALSNPTKRRLCAALVTAALAGCGGGGGGSPGPTGPAPVAVAPGNGGGTGTEAGNPPASVPGPYPNLSNASGGDVRVYTALLSEVNAGAQFSGPIRGQVTATADGKGNYTFKVNGIGDTQAYSFTVGTTSASALGPLNGTSCGNCWRAGRFETADVIGVFAYLDPTAAGMSYMTVGAWGTNNKAHGSSFSEGAGVVGVPTRAADIPKTGTANYTGQFIGSLGTNGGGRVIGATAQSTANFGTGVVTLQTSNSQFTEGAPGNTSGFDFAGTMTIQSSGGARTNQLRGVMATKNGMTGDAHGSFFGPAAQELGGAVVFKGDAVNSNSFMGGFGLKKQ